MKIAIYVRVSTQDQTVENQKIPLKQYCDRMGWEYEIFEEKESTRKTRPVQWELYNKLLRKEYDGLVIYSFSRWARSTQELIEHMEKLIEKEIQIYSYTENLDINTSMGKAMFTIISAFNQLERDLIRERTIAGLKRAKAQGKIRGRHPRNCGCGYKDIITGKIHNGNNKPIRNNKNQIVGWRFGKSTLENENND